MSVREYIIDSADEFHIVKVQDCSAILRAIKETPDHISSAYAAKSAMKYLGSVPNLIALNWAKEWGVKLYSHEWMEKARKRLMHDPDWSSLKVR